MHEKAMDQLVAVGSDQHIGLSHAVHVVLEAVAAAKRVCVASETQGRPCSARGGGAVKNASWRYRRSLSTAISPFALAV